jgi:hypothetical protein
VDGKLGGELAAIYQVTIDLYFLFFILEVNGMTANLTVAEIQAAADGASAII